MYGGIIEIQRKIHEFLLNGQFKEELEAFLRSDEILPITLEAIETSDDQNSIFYLVTALKRRILNEWEVSFNEIGDDVFNLIKSRLINLSVNLEPKLILQLISCMAFIASCDLSYCVQISEFDPNFTLFFYEFLCETSYNTIFFNYSNVIQFIKESIPMFIQILEEADISNEWFRFFNTVARNTDLCNVLSLFPKFHPALDVPELYPALSHMIENIVKIPFSGLCPSDYPFIEQIFAFATELIEKVLEQPTLDRKDYLFISDTYQQLFSYEVSFYLQEDHVEFTETFFENFIDVLKSFIVEGVEQELVQLLSKACRFVQNVIQDVVFTKKTTPLCSVFSKLLFDFIVDLVNTYETRYICKKLSLCLKKLTCDDLRYAIEYFVTVIKQEEFSAGHVYAISYIDRSRYNIANIAAISILNMEEPPFTVVYFVRNCIGYCSEQFDPLMHLVYQMFEEMPMEVATTVADVAKTQNLFARMAADPETYIAPILEWFELADEEITSMLLSALFTVLSRTSPEDNDVAAIFEQLATAFDTVVTSLVEEDIIEAIKFVTTVINGTPKEEIDPAFAEYFQEIFNAFFPVLEGQWEDMSPSVQEPLALMMSKALSHQWADPETYAPHVVEWLQIVFPVNATRDHFNALVRVEPFVEPELVAWVLAEFGALSDSSTLDACNFARKIVERTANPDLALVALQFLLEMVDHGPLVSERALSVIMRLAKDCDNTPIPVVAENVHAIVETLFNHLVAQSVPQYIFSVLSVLWELQSAADQETIVGLIVESAGSTPEATEFAEVFLKEFSSPQPSEKIIEAACNMIRAIV